MMYSVRCFRRFCENPELSGAKRLFAVSVASFVAVWPKAELQHNVWIYQKESPGFPSEQFLFNRKFLLLNKNAAGAYYIPRRILRF